MDTFSKPKRSEIIRDFVMGLNNIKYNQKFEPNYFQRIKKIGCF